MQTQDDRYMFLMAEMGDLPDVERRPAGLFVGNKVFAFFDGNDLIIVLGASRASDLVERGAAVRYIPSDQSDPHLLRISDRQFWPELAREALEYVGEPAVGGAS